MHSPVWEEYYWLVKNKHLGDKNKGITLVGTKSESKLGFKS